MKEMIYESIIDFTKNNNIGLKDLLFVMGCMLLIMTIIILIIVIRQSMLMKKYKKKTINAVTIKDRGADLRLVGVVKTQFYEMP